MKCLNCGAELNDDALFCTNCGTSTSESTAPKEDDWIACPKCSSHLPLNSKFCSYCGTVLNTNDNLYNSNRKNKSIVKNKKLFSAFFCLILIFLAGFIYYKTYSTPEKTFSQFCSSINSTDLDEALDYTNLDALLEDENISSSQTEQYYEYYESALSSEFSNTTITVNSFSITSKSSTSAVGTANISLSTSSSTTSQTVTISFVKENGQWLIDLSSLSISSSSSSSSDSGSSSNGSSGSYSDYGSGSSSDFSSGSSNGGYSSGSGSSSGSSSGSDSSSDSSTDDTESAISSQEGTDL